MRLRPALVLLSLFLAAPAQAVTGPEAVDRAQQWVDAQMPYCQVPYGGCDSHVCCGAGYRPENPDWDAYRSDCSGLVSWAWDLGGPGRVTWQFAPFDTTVSYEIDATQLQPGDALNSNEHVMLFAGWVDYLNVATLIDESDWGTPAQRRDLAVTVSGSTVTRTDWTSNPFTAIRYTSIQPACTPGCNGTVIVGADCGQGDCAAYGSTCVDDSLGVRCVFSMCPAQGESTICLPDGHTLGHCHDGALDQLDCAATNQVCEVSGSDASCVAPATSSSSGSSGGSGSGAAATSGSSGSGSSSGSSGSASNRTGSGSGSSSGGRAVAVAPPDSAAVDAPGAQDVRGGCASTPGGSLLALLGLALLSRVRRR